MACWHINTKKCQVKNKCHKCDFLKGVLTLLVECYCHWKAQQAKRRKKCIYVILKQLHCLLSFREVSRFNYHMNESTLICVSFNESVLLLMKATITAMLWLLLLDLNQTDVNVVGNRHTYSSHKFAVVFFLWFWLVWNKWVPHLHNL